MGQITNPSAPGFQVRPVDRQSGPAAGAGASGNKSIFIGAGAGLNSTASNLIVIGNGALQGPMVDATESGTIAIGVSALAANTGSDIAARPNTAIGNLAGQAMTVGGGNVLLGASALVGGSGGGGGGAGILNNVVIGDLASSGTTAAGLGFSQNVVIGASAGICNGGTFTQSVFIGQGAGNGMSNVGGASTTQSTVIGFNSGIGLRQSQQCVIVGANSVNTFCHGTQNTYLGNSIVHNCPTQSVGNTIVGATGQLPDNVQHCLALGFGAGFSIGSGSIGNLVIEVWDGVTNVNVLYGDFTRGNLYFGNNGGNNAQRELTGLNNFKLFNGTKVTAAPLGGGYFYCLAGALHWVGTAGTDTTIAPA
jgi:hypothetical protein